MNLNEDALNLNSNVLYVWGKKKVITTTHGISRLIQRRSSNYKALKELFKRALMKLDQIATRVNEEILFFSSSLNQGFVAAVTNDQNLRLITFLPHGHNFAKSGTSVQFVENLSKNYRVVEIDTVNLSQEVLSLIKK
jgi:hypothetical protein